MNIAKQGTTSLITETFTDETGNPIASFDALTLTLYDNDSDGIINTREGIAIASWGGSSGFTAGTLTVLLGPADNAILGDGAPISGFEMHTLLVEGTYNTASKVKVEIPIAVQYINHIFVAP